jgi:hypothetical protein
MVMLGMMVMMVVVGMVMVSIWPVGGLRTPDPGRRVMDAGRRTLDRETQAVQAGGGCRLAMKMKLFRKEGVQRLFNRLQIRAYRNQGREQHIAAGASDTVKSNVFFHN